MLSPILMNFIVWFSVSASTVIAVVWLMTLCGRSAAHRHFCWCCGLIGIVALPVLGLFGPELRVEPGAIPADWGHPIAATNNGDPSSLLALPSANADFDFDFEPPIIDRSYQDTTALSSKEVIAIAASKVKIAKKQWQPEEQFRAATSGFEQNLSTIVAWVWPVGVLLGIAILARDFVCLRKLRRQSTEVTSHPAVRQLAQAIGLHAGIRVKTHHECKMPMTWGISSPIILLPEEFCEWSPSQLKTVLSHESTHIARHDWTWLLLARMTCLLAWFHPVVLFAAYRLRQESEKAVDDRLLASGIEASAYAELLMFFAHIGKQQGRAVLSMAVSPVESRIRHILSVTRPQSRLSTVMATLILALTFGSVVAIAAVRTPAKSQPSITADTPGNDAKEAGVQVLAPDQFEKVKRPVGVDSHETNADSFKTNADQSATVVAQQSDRRGPHLARPSSEEIEAAMDQEGVLPELTVTLSSLDTLENHFDRVLNLAGPDAAFQRRNLSDFLDLIFYGIDRQLPFAVQFTAKNVIRIHAPIGNHNALIDDNLGTKFQLQRLNNNQYRAIDPEKAWVIVGDTYATLSTDGDEDHPPQPVSKLSLNGDVEFKFRNQRTDLVSQAARENFFLKNYRSAAANPNRSLPLNSLIALYEIYAEHIYSEAVSVSLHTIDLVKNNGRITAIPGSSLDATFARFTEQHESRLHNIAFQEDSTLGLHCDYPLDKWHHQFVATIGQLALLNIDKNLNNDRSDETEAFDEFAEQLIDGLAMPDNRLTGFLNMYGSPKASTTLIGIQADSTAVRLLHQKAAASGVFDSVQIDNKDSEASLHRLTYTQNKQTTEVIVGYDDQLIWIGLGPDARNGLAQAIKSSNAPPRAGLPIQAKVHVPRLLSMLDVVNTPASTADNTGSWATVSVKSNRPSEAVASIQLGNGALAVLGHIIARFCQENLAD